MAFVLLAVSVGILAVVTLLPIWRYEAWWVRAQDFPRLQYAALALILLAIELLALDLLQHQAWLLIAVTVACLVYQAWWIYPYTPWHRQEVKSADAPTSEHVFRIMSVNVLMPNRSVKALLRIIGDARPDVIIAVETDLWWQGQLEVLEQEYPHILRCPLDNQYGMHVYSRFVLEDAAIQFLVEPGVPSMHALLVLPSGPRIKLHCVHPKPPSPTENPGSSERDAELIAVAKNVAESESSSPVVVAGDLNDVAWSATTRLFRKTSRLLDPRVGRGMYNTFHAGYPFLRWPLDHLFHSDHFETVSLTRLPAFGSDHFPILIELAFRETPKTQQEGVTRDDDDRQRAREKVAAEGVSKKEVHSPGG